MTIYTTTLIISIIIEINRSIRAYTYVLKVKHSKLSLDIILTILLEAIEAFGALRGPSGAHLVFF